MISCSTNWPERWYSWLDSGKLPQLIKIGVTKFLVKKVSLIRGVALPISFADFVFALHDIEQKELGDTHTSLRFATVSEVEYFCSSLEHLGVRLLVDFTALGSTAEGRGGEAEIPLVIRQKDTRLVRPEDIELYPALVVVQEERFIEQWAKALKMDLR